MNKLFGPILKMVYRVLVAPSLQRAKIQAVMYYLQTIRSVRQAVMTLGVLALCMAMIAGGAVLIPLALCLLMPWQPLTKALVACAFGALYITVPLVVAIVLMSEKRWMRMTRADELVKNVLRK